MNEPLHILNAFAHCPRCGSGDFSEQGFECKVCAQCGHAQHFNPVAAVGAIISDAQGRVLLIERAHEPSKGCYAVPGGFTALDENLETALLREVQEETGLELQNLKYVSSHPNQYAYKGVSIPTLDVFFAAQLEHIEVAPQESEVSGWELLPLQAINMERIAFESMRHALRTYAAQT